MSKIINFDPHHYDKNPGAKRKIQHSKNIGDKSNQNASSCKIYDISQDCFERQVQKKPKKGISFSRMLDLVGEEKVDEIFSMTMRKTSATGIISPVDKNSPLKESLKYVWDNSDEAKKRKLECIHELSDLKLAFRMLEREASSAYAKKTGESADIKIAIQDVESGEKIYITDSLNEQIKFLRKNKLSVSAELIKEKVKKGFDSLISGFYED